jgi:hypothetical protein
MIRLRAMDLHVSTGQVVVGITEARLKLDSSYVVVHSLL